MTPPPVRRVFLSYAREDLTWAEEQARTFRAVGIEVFLDVLTLRAGDDWAARIHDEIGRADQVRVGWSRYAAQSEWVRKEFTEALRVQTERGAQSFLHVDRLDDTPLPEELKHIHAERSALSSPETDNLLRDPYRLLPPGAPQPSTLLRPEYQVVPFHGRAEIIERTEAWCLSGKPFDLVLYVGAGGSGKTRLFAEVCARMRGQGWETGFLDANRAEEARRSDPDRLGRLLGPRLPRLVVVDYAESRREVVQAILERAAGKRGGQPVRLVLLARTAGDWWREMLRASPEFEPLLGAGIHPVSLPPLTPALEDRRAAFDAALATFAGVLGAAAPVEVQIDLEPEHFGQPLFLQLTALLTVLGDQGASPADLLDRLLDHEERYWRQVARDIGLDRKLDPALAPCVALTTLVGGSAEGEELRRLLGRSPLLADTTVLERKAVGDVIARLYGWNGRVEALQPDRVGEALVAREIARDRSLLHAWHPDADETQIRQGLTVLGRVAVEREETRGWLADLLSAESRKLAEPAMEVAIEGIHTVAHALTAVFEAQPNPELAFELASVLPHDTVVLRELAVELTNQALAAASTRVLRAALLSNLGYRLTALGRLQTAFTVTQEATEMYRRLAEADPEYLPNLAITLSNLGLQLRNLGRKEEAFARLWEAVEHGRHLIETHGDLFLPDLARSLSNLVIVLSERGEQREAVKIAREAVEAHRILAAKGPNTFLPDFAMSLGNLGIALRVAGHRSEALATSHQVVGIYRELASRNPDAFLPDLARSLNNLGLDLVDAGHHQEAIMALKESAHIRRQLAAVYPAAFNADLRNTLMSLSKLLFQLGKAEESLAVAEELRCLDDHRSYTDLATSEPETGQST